MHSVVTIVVLPNCPVSCFHLNNFKSERCFYVLGDEIPEETLPEPFNRPQKAFHLSPHFIRRFSQKSEENGADNVQQKSPLDSLQPLAFPVSESNLKKNPPFEDIKSHLKTSPVKLASDAAGRERCPTICASLESSSAPPTTPSKTIEYTENKDGSLKSIDVMSTLAKLVSTPSWLMSATHALPPLKRPYTSPNHGSKLQSATAIAAAT
ncbi:CDT protein a [Spatholobus suberectus]|nr:CDT protein a [Spatholobus suberectus]